MQRSGFNVTFRSDIPANAAAKRAEKKEVAKEKAEAEDAKEGGRTASYRTRAI